MNVTDLLVALEAEAAQGHIEAAESRARAALLAAPDEQILRVALGTILAAGRRFEEAEDSFREALRRDPRMVPVWRNIGLCAMECGRIDDAESAFLNHLRLVDRAALQPVNEEDLAPVHWDLAQIALLRGDYRRGFSLFRARFKAVPGLQRLSLPKPYWRGEDLAGKTILLHDEQGLGDALMMARYIPLLAQKGATVWCLVHPALVSFFEGLPGVAGVGPRDCVIPSSFDYVASLFDLPLYLGVGKWGLPVAAKETPPRAIAVVWAGAPLHIRDAARSVPLPLFARLFETQGVSFFSFTRDKRPGDEALLATTPVEDLSPRLTDIKATALLLKDMDLVITCDTSTVHLAGLLGKEVWALLPFAPDWRWGVSGETSIWYPKLRLFRQSKRDAWGDVIDRVCRALEARRA